MWAPPGASDREFRDPGTGVPRLSASRGASVGVRGHYEPGMLFTGESCFIILLGRRSRSATLFRNRQRHPTVYNHPPRERHSFKPGIPLNVKLHKCFSRTRTSSLDDEPPWSRWLCTFPLIVSYECGAIVPPGCLFSSCTYLVSFHCLWPPVTHKTI